MSAVGLLGRDGGKLAAPCDDAIIVPSDVPARIQEAHIQIGHTLCGLIEKGLGPALPPERVPKLHARGIAAAEVVVKQRKVGADQCLA